MAGNNVRIVASLDDKVTGPLGRLHDKFDTLGKSQGFKAVAQGVGMGAGISAYNLLDRAISGVIGVAGDSVKAYQEEQSSIARLGAALRANVPDWDGNTAAIEKVLTARMKLGFSDEEQRVSLGQLSAATGDVTRALDLERVAMDLAAFQHTDLATASDLLIKVQAGSFRALKGLGISTTGVTTSMQALNLIQKVVAGSAAALAQTDEGKLKVAQDEVNEAMEKMGKGLSHLEAEVLPRAADAIVSFADSLDSLSTNTDREVHQIGDVWETVFGHSIGLYLDSAETKAIKSGQVWDSVTSGMVTSVEHMRGDFETNFLAVDAAVANASRIAATEAGELPQKMAKNLSAGYDEIKAASTALGEAMKNPIKSAAREKALNSILDGKGSVGKRLAAGLASADPVVRQKAEALKQSIIDELEAIRNIQISIRASVSMNKGNYKGGARAGGGPVEKDTPYLVGEEGREIFVPDTNGRIVPHGRSVSGSGGSVFVTNIALDGKTIARVVLKEESFIRGLGTFSPG